ncbi:MAG: fibronectin type III domain protein [Treponematales bacterium]
MMYRERVKSTGAAALAVLAALLFSGCPQIVTDNPTGSIAFRWQPDGKAGGSQAVSSPGAVAVGPINSGVASVVITLTNTAAQSLAKSGTDAKDVTISSGNGKENRTLTVKNVSSGGNKEFTITVSESGKSSIVYTVTVTVSVVSLPSKTFWAQTATTGAWYQITAAKAGESAHCVVYGDSSLLGQRFTTSQAQAIADEYEAHVYSQITGAFGGIEDVDKNGRVILLLLDIVDGYSPQSGGGYVAGYFDSTHMYTSNYSYSNQADMLFMDVNPGTPGDATFNATMAHELQHLINWSETVAKNRNEKTLWMNEGLSTGAEYIYGGDPGGRVAIYNAYTNPGNSSYSTAQRIDSFFHWDSSLMDYSTDYLFFQWLRLHASNGAGIYKEIIQSYNSGDYRDVTAAASSKIDSQFADWNKLLSTWIIANRVQNTDGYYGYKRTAFLNTLLFTGSSISLKPGEGAFSQLSGTKSLPNSGDIRYLAVNANAATVDEDGSYNGTATPFVLTYNVNTNPEGNPSTGQLAGSAAAGSLLLSGDAQPTLSVSGGAAVPVPALPETYPVSFGDMRRLREQAGEGAR